MERSLLKRIGTKFIAGFTLIGALAFTQPVFAETPKQTPVTQIENIPAQEKITLISLEPATQIPEDSTLTQEQPLISEPIVVQPTELILPESKSEITSFTDLQQEIPNIGSYKFILGGGLTHPFTNLEDLNQVWDGVQQGVGYLSDYLKPKIDSPSSFLDVHGLHAKMLDVSARSLQIGALSFLANSDCSHESSHMIEFVNHGNDLNIKFTTRGQGKGFDFLFSKWNHGFPSCDYVSGISEEILRALSKSELTMASINSINSDALNGLRTLDRVNEQGVLSVYDALLFATRASYASKYLTVYDGFNNYWASDYSRQEIIGDFDVYQWYLDSNGIKITKNEFLQNMLLTTALSVPFWQSLYHLGDFVVTGNRYTRPWTLKINKDLEFSLPNFTHFLTPKGEYVDMTLYANPGSEHPIRFSFGSDLDWVTDGNGNVIRGSIGFYNLKLKGVDYLDKIAFSPSIAIDLERSSLRPKGHALNLLTSAPITEELKLQLGLRSNSEDTLENEIIRRRANLEGYMQIQITY